jgi:hypothetical protein
MGITWQVNSGPRSHTGNLLFLKYPSLLHTQKDQSGAMEEVCYWTHIADEKTEVQRL